MWLCRTARPDRLTLSYPEYYRMTTILEIIGGIAVCYIGLSIALYWRAART